MLSTTLLSTPAWADRFAAMNLLHDTQDDAPIEMTDNDVDRLLSEDPGGPVVMLNLLRFRADGGRERYMEYASRSIPIAARFGAEPLYVGDGDRALVGEAGQAWTLCSSCDTEPTGIRGHGPGRAGAHLRTEALTEAVLQPTVALA